MADSGRRSRSRTPRGRRGHSGQRRRDSRANSYSDDYRSDDYTDYSDSFASDDDRPPPRKNKTGAVPKYAVRKPVTAPYSNKTKTKGRLQNSSTEGRVDPVARIMQAARRLKVNELKNELEVMAVRCRDLEEENKVLKRLQRRQEKALEKFEDKEGDLPQLIQRHNNETRSLKDQIRKVKERNSRVERSLHDSETEKEQLRRQVNKYKELADERGLPERDELHRRVLNVEADLQDKDKRVRDLERHVENLTKNHKHQMGIEIARYKELQRRHEEMTETFNRTQVQLKEKEKELDIKNIYANRMSRPPRQPVSYGGTPHESPSPHKADRPRRLSNSDLTPRQKAKNYEQERRQKEKMKIEQKKDSEEKLAWEQLELDRLEGDKQRQENEDKERRDRENREMRAREEKEIQERMEREQQEIRLRLERERKEQLVREERREQEEQEKQWREERRLAEERDRKQQEELQIKQEEERDRQERARLEEERRAREERERMENDAKLQEERRKKDELLARLKQLDQDANKKEDKNPFFITNDQSSDTSSAASKKSSYSFTKQTENLHNGKPAFDDIPGPFSDKARIRRSILNEPEVGYQPSFGESSSKPKKTGPIGFSTDNPSPQPTSDFSSKKARKGNLMDELFGKNRENSTTFSKENSSDVIDFSENKKKSNTVTKFPWDEKSVGDTNDKQSLQARQKSSTLFGGGSALVDEDTSVNSNQGHLLPRRTRQQPTTFQSKPTVNAVDNFDDDIEEVIL